MKKLGISVYPEHVSKEECYEYMKLAGKYGFKRVFTCFLSVKETKEDIISRFSEFCRKAHDSGLMVSVDTNPEIFKKLNATPLDLAVFARMGVDIIRLDGHFGEFEDIEITRNPYQIRIEYNSSTTIALDLMLENGANRKNMCLCSNFYPQRNTGMGLKRYIELSSRYQSLGLDNAAFVTSQEEHTHGPWEVYDGLCTLEIHRNLPIDVQARHLNGLGYCNDILIGNAFASKEELKALAELNLNKLTMKAELEEDVSDLEKEIIVWPFHASRDDCNELLVRASASREAFRGREIVPRKNKKRAFKKGMSSSSMIS